MKRILLFLLLATAATTTASAQASRTLSLNGRWKAAVADSCPEAFPYTVPVPGVMSQAAPDPGIDFDATLLKEDVGYNYVWYTTDFDLSASQDGYDNDNYSHALLRIRAKYNALVILNGVEIGYDAHCTYSHAEFDVTRALNFNGKNRLVVRVGSWNTASYPSRENAAEWWRNSRAPGICDDVTLQLTHEVTIRHLKLIPVPEEQVVLCTARISNFGESTRTLRGRITVDDCRFDPENDFDVVPTVSELDCGEITLPGASTRTWTFRIPAANLKPWTPGREGDPQRYRANFVVSDDDAQDCKTEVFGYRDIRVSGKDVLINGRKVFFRAENIAFQRALNRWADAVFDETWIRRFLRSVVEEYGFNYLRIHLGHAYSKWYDIADEMGVMIQDEWRFMHDREPEGEELAETEIEFRRWIEQNVNHPSIVAWDQENEGNVRLDSLKAELRRYDPSRLWSEDDFQALHLYGYSETLTDRPEFPFDGTRPATVLESCRLWLNEQGDLEVRESFKTGRTAAGWGLYFYRPEEVEQLQADLHADLGTFYRSRRIQAWAPFALLSGAVNGQNFFRGNLTDSLVPKRNLEVLARLNEPIGASIEMNQAREWYRERTTYRPNRRYRKNVWIWNDTDSLQSVELQVALCDLSGNELTVRSAKAEIPPYGVQAVETGFAMPRKEGVYLLKPRIVTAAGERIPGVERRLMVAREPEPWSGVLAFGGHDKPFEGCRSILENFAGRKLDPEVQSRIVNMLRGELIDKVSLDNGILIQSTLISERGGRIIRERKFDNAGNPLSNEAFETLTFGMLPESIRQRIIEETGTVPVDEAKIRIRRQGEECICTVTTIGSDRPLTIRISPDGAFSELQNDPAGPIAHNRAGIR